MCVCVCASAITLQCRYQAYCIQCYQCGHRLLLLVRVVVISFLNCFRIIATTMPMIRSRLLQLLLLLLFDCLPCLLACCFCNKNHDVVNYGDDHWAQACFFFLVVFFFCLFGRRFFITSLGFPDYYWCCCYCCSLGHYILSYALCHCVWPLHTAVNTVCNHVAVAVTLAAFA